MKFAVMFPGQGSQYSGMCVDMARSDVRAMRVFEEASEILKTDLIDMIENAPMKVFTMSENAQPATVAASCVLYRKFVEETGAVPDVLVGHSLGEISALICSGGISFGDGIAFTRERGRLMQRALEDKNGFAGIVTDMEAAELERMVKKMPPGEYAAITGYNSPNQFLVAGSPAAARILDDEVEKAGGQFIPFKMIPMKANAPYHSRLMSYLGRDIEAAVKKTAAEKPKIPVWSTVTGKKITNRTEIREILAGQLTRPVLWSQALNGIRAEGARLMVDIGPNRIIRNLVREDESLPPALAYDDMQDRETILNIFNERMKKSA